MAHYAFLNEDNIVIQVIVGIDETETIEGLETETWYQNFYGRTCTRTSYNGNIRKNFAGVGYTYDGDRDAFIAPEPEENIGFDEETCRWLMPERTIE
jgi:hypothetical protein